MFAGGTARCWCAQVGRTHWDRRICFFSVPLVGTAGLAFASGVLGPEEPLGACTLLRPRKRGFGCRGAARGCWPSVVAGLLCPFQAVTASRAAFRSPLPSAFLRAFSNGVPFPRIVPLLFCQQLLLRSVSLHSSVPSGVVVPPEVRRTFCSARGLLARARRDSSAFWSCR